MAAVRMGVVGVTATVSGFVTLPRGFEVTGILDAATGAVVVVVAVVAAVVSRGLVAEPARHGRNTASSSSV